MDLQLNKKVALVTGAGQGVGCAIARALAVEGAHVVVHYHQSECEARDLVDELNREGCEAIALSADLTDYEQVTALIRRVTDYLGTVDILVNNAGYYEPRRFIDTSRDNWHAEIGVGLYGVIHTMHSVLPSMIEKGWGRIVNITGDSARMGERFLSLTAASRGGVISLTKSVAREVGAAGVTANMISLGLIETHRTDPSWLEKNRDKILKLYPIKRVGKPEDAAAMAAFLASDQASWITGQVISVSGGFSMC